MLGYVTIEKPQLKIWEHECYTGYYCGICKSIGSRYGQIPRLALSYDAAFLALLLASFSPQGDMPTKEHCLTHPVRKKTVLRNEAIDYAGDVMLLLAWHKLQDDIRDEGRTYAKVTARLMKGLFQKLRNKHPNLCREMEEGLAHMSALEEAKCDSLDQVAEAFAKIMETIFAAGPLPQPFPAKQALSHLGYHLGKWIYLTDALDDLEENIQTGAYNPLLYRFQYKRDEADFRGRILESCRFSLLHYLAEMGKALDLLPLQKNKGILENIIYMGLHRKTQEQTQPTPPPKKQLKHSPKAIFMK